MEKEQYASLKNEIMFNHEQENKAVQFIYGVVSALWAVSITAKKPAIILISFVIIIPISLRIADFRNSIAHLSACMIAYWGKGENNKPDWETVNRRYHDWYPREKAQRFIYQGARLDCLFLCLCSGAFYWLMRGDSVFAPGERLRDFTVITFQLIIILFEGVISWKFSDVARLQKGELEKWNEVKERNQ